MVTTLYLIRHGETEGSGEKRYKGSIDVPLSEAGITQASGLAEYMKGSVGGVSAVYCSGLQRAVNTALPIARAFGLEPVPVEGLRERHFGAWEGMSFDEIEAAYPDAFLEWARDPLRFSPIGGESTLGLRDRAVEALEGILGGHRGKTLVVVAHGGINRALICHFMGVPLQNIFRVEQGFACVNIIELGGENPGFPVLRLLNGGPFHDDTQRVFG
jgi:broad specificity phosphatase PhoE